MSARFFIDTNLFVYSVDPDEPRKAKRAKAIIREGLESGNGIISYQVVQEFFRAAFRFADPMSAFAAQAFMDTVFRPLLAVHSSPALFVSALQTYARYKFSWYDCLIVAAAQEADCSILYTEDMQHGRRIGGLRIENPLL